MDWQVASWKPGQSQTPATGVQVLAVQVTPPPQLVVLFVQAGTSVLVHQRKLPLQGSAMGSVPLVNFDRPYPKRFRAKVSMPALARSAMALEFDNTVLSNVAVASLA